MNPGLGETPTPSVNNDYTPASSSMAEWGTVWKVPGMEMAPEFSYYTSENYSNIDLQFNST